MPELRKDELSGIWVAIATERGKRPHDFARPQELRKGGACPFCYGNEGLTPPEVLAFRNGSPPNAPGWSVRVVPNKFPALGPGAEPGCPRRVGPHVAMNGAGAHEVLIESPRHDSTMGTHGTEQVGLVLRALRERSRWYRESGRARYVQAFKNWGAAAGASLEHTHFQLIALPLSPAVVEAEMRRMDPGDGRGRCTLCEVVAFESREGERVVGESDLFVAYSPFASRFPYETWIAPKRHLDRFEDSPDDLLDELAVVLRDTVRRIEVSLEDPPYNLMLHTAPFDAAEGAFHWHIEIAPRLTITAGFELGTGCFINPTPPEMAAALLRAIDVDSDRTELAGEARPKGVDARDTGP